MQNIDKAMYDKIVEKLIDCVAEYDRKKFENNKFILSLANGEIITVRFPKNNIAHLLGINVDSLRRNNLVKKNSSSYDSLKSFIDDSYSLYKKVNQGQISFDDMLSENINEKLDCFLDNINIRTDDIYCVIKYDNEKTYKFEDHAEICDYYIIRRVNAGYCVLGLVKSELVEGVYIPATSRKYVEYSEFESFIKRIAIKQEITYPYMMKVENLEKDYSASFTLKLEDKYTQVEKIAAMANKYDATAAVIKDFSFSLGRQNNDKVAKENILTVLRLLSENVKNGNFLDKDTIVELCGEIELPQDVISIINTCNAVLYSSNCINQNLTEYSKMNDENTSMKSELENLRNELNKYKKENGEYKNNILELEKINKNYNEQLNILDEAFTKVKSMNKEA